MSPIRYSLASLLVGLIGIGLGFASLRAFDEDASRWEVSIGGLSIATLLVVGICYKMEQSAQGILVSGTLLYVWGVVCLLVVESYFLGVWTRVAMALVGVIIAASGWFSAAACPTAEPVPKRPSRPA